MSDLIEKAEQIAAEAESRGRDYAGNFNLHSFSGEQRVLVREFMTTAFMAGTKYGMDLLPKPTMWQLIFGGWK